MKKNNSIKIALIGAYPPPYGGVSVHIQRVSNKLNELGIYHNIYDLSFENCLENIKKDNVLCIKHPILWFLTFFFSSKEDILHLHISDWRLRFLFSLMKFKRKKIVISIHGESLEKAYSEGSFIRKLFIKKSLSWSSHIIALNDRIKNKCLNLGVSQEKISVIPSYIPVSKFEEDDSELSENLKKFIKSHSPIILANAFKLRFFNGIDLYGLDLCIDSCSVLKEKYPKIGFVFCLPQIGDYNYLKKMKSRIIQKNIKNNFIIYTNQGSMIPIIKKCNIFLRPTNTDGDSISIREALSMGIPTIASDVINRPFSVVVFKNRDISDLVIKIKYVLKKYNELKKKIKNDSDFVNFNRTLEIYVKL